MGITITSLKKVLRYDDSLDCFGVHAVGGIIGAILTGVCASAALGGSGLDICMGAQVGKQFVGVLSTIVYDGIISFIILKILDVIIGLRVTEEEKTEGLDLTLHG